MLRPLMLRPFVFWHAWYRRLVGRLGVAGRTAAAAPGTAGLWLWALRFACAYGACNACCAWPTAYFLLLWPCVRTSAGSGGCNASCVVCGCRYSLPADEEPATSCGPVWAA